MKTIVSGLIAAWVPAAAFAHPSVMSHEHPHGLSILPDLTLVLVAGLVVVVGLIAFRHFRKG